MPLDAVNVASVAIIMDICYVMGKESITDWRTIVIGLLSIAVTFNFRRINSALVVMGGATIGYLLTIII
jgi:chromate transporter